MTVSSDAKTRHTPCTPLASSHPPTEHHQALHRPGGVGSISHRSCPAHAHLCFSWKRNMHPLHPRRLFRMSACSSSPTVSTSFATFFGGFPIFYPFRTLNASSSFSRTCMCRAAYASCISSCRSALHAETMAMPRVDVSALATSDGSLEFRIELSGGRRSLGRRNWRERGATWTRWMDGSPPHVVGWDGKEGHVAVQHVGLQWSTEKDVQETAGTGGMANLRDCRQKNVRCARHMRTLLQIQMNQTKRELNSLRNLRLRRPSSDTIVYLLDIHWMSDSTCVLVNSGCTCIHSRRFSSAT